MQHLKQNIFYSVFVFAVLLSLSMGFISNPAYAQNPKTLLFQDADQAKKDADAAEASIFSPGQYETAEKKYAEAEDGFKKGKNLEDLKKKIEMSRVYYLKAIDEFINLITAAGFLHEEVEKVFDEWEIKVVKERGYGSQNFVFILESLFAEFSAKSKELIDRARLKKIITRFNLHPIQPPVLFEDVIGTLEYLSKKYSLYLLTKGDYTEQQGKIQRAGVLPYFTDYFIPDEKDDTTYKNLLKEMNWKAENTCMVGNSPKSDINPALRNGMYAVFIPYKETWKLDKEPVQSIDGRLVILENFSDLRKIF